MELKLPEQIDVIDITMRDGLQNEEHMCPWRPNSIWLTG